MGQFGFVYYVGKNVTHYLKENMRMTVMVKEGADSSEVKELRELIRSAPQVKEWRFVSKEEAADNYTEELGEDFRSVLGYNPLPATFGSVFES
jgi:cell division transport system permease protein